MGKCDNPGISKSSKLWICLVFVCFQFVGKKMELKVAYGQEECLCSQA